MGLAIVIMAAGKGTRLKSRRPKVLHAIGGKPLLEHVIAAASRIVAPADIYAVVGHEAASVEAAVAGTGVGFVLQAEQLGTGHAIQCAQEAIRGYDNVLVLSGDVPLIRPETIGLLWEFHQAQDAAMTILTARPENPFGYGRVVRRGSDSAEVEAIVEQKSLSAGQEEIGEINSGIYAFKTAALLQYLSRIEAGNSAGEYYLTDLAGILVAAGERVVAVEAADPEEVLGANTIAELVSLDATLRAQNAERLMAQGVTIFRPETSVIDADVEVGPDTVIEPFVQLLGKTRIGSDCLIRSSTVIENSTIEDGVIVRQSCVIAESTIGSGARIGPFAHIRPGSEIGEDAHVGNFVETKKARLGKGAKANHLTYLGDAEVGAGSNIGAGVITCNYDGVNKHTTKIGAGVFVGSDSTLVAPITLGDGCYVGAGSCITKDVPEDALAVGRSKQVIKEGWAVAKRKRLRGEC
ncbi:bifunctional UDP-N-acetylglucosamine diphosphorylase/glucosamine-1-phosphate N-acetyltransferase GlmU [Acidicapsa ligni]|uniref:bifunctional UDP-N-acetylglucosamine diphosphorylase/glucosamine-1-phosphate N-acetyltransferase GlmU n=1 Tax=Acidicapsa ligni TaxID=542300 RepID=UPI0021E03717|nr:bifunctional UDP-N-acetylglucosamine diphosphorylase/glucosamine-1-phosphate N-acetyltransferase GlmU [Acidicapsa ligni]